MKKITRVISQSPPVKIDTFEHTLLAGQCVKRGIKLADLGKEARQMVIDGKFKVKAEMKHILR